MRIALLTYRGNMFCGGQGIYAAYIARELTALGHQVHVIAGPPLPELEPGIPLHVIPNRNFFARELDEVLAEARLAPGDILAGIERFVKERPARIKALRDAVDAAERHD